MKAVICFALLTVVSGTVVETKEKVAKVEQVLPQVNQGFYYPGAQQPYYLNRGAAYYPGNYQTFQQQYQIPFYQQAQYEAVRYTQPQQFIQYQKPAFISKTTVPVATPVATPVVAPVAKPLLKQYQVNEAAPQWAIVRSNLDNNFDGNFQFDFETENGISHSAVGGVKQLSPKEQAQVVQGQYSYISPEGQVITTRYTADENGFVAQGDHLPVAPEVPELPPLIAKSLAYIRSLPPQPENQE